VGISYNNIQSIHSEIQKWRTEERIDSAAKHAESRSEMEAIRREMMALSASVKTAFPGGDFDGHRRYHELLISREEQKQQIRREIITHLLKGSTWAMLLGLFWMMIKSAKDYFR
jgi:hypothetical protein